MTGVQTCALPIFGIAVESIQRLIEPRGVAFAEATVVAVLGLMVNLVSAWLLSDGHHHGHGVEEHHHHDHELRSTYFPVLARSEELRVGKEIVSTFISRWSPDN